MALGFFVEDVAWSFLTADDALPTFPQRAERLALQTLETNTLHFMGTEVVHGRTVGRSWD